MMGERRDAREFERLKRTGNREVLRQNLVRRIKRQQRAIEQMRVDVESWNQNTRQPHEQPIDWDADGRMSRLLAKLDQDLQELLDQRPQGTS